MPTQTFRDGTHTHNYYPSQREIQLEVRDNRITLVFTDSEKKVLEKRAASHGYSQLGVYLRNLIKIGVKVENRMNQTLADILK